MMNISLLNDHFTERSTSSFTERTRSHPKTRITRIQLESGRLKGWRVKFSLHRNKVVRVFSDPVYGTTQKARDAAEAFANQEAIYCQEVLSLMRRLYVRNNSRSGVPGVTRVERNDRGPNWVAYWDENGRKVQKKFAVSVYGEERAKEMAVKARRTGTKPYVRRLKELKSILKLM